MQTTPSFEKTLLVPEQILLRDFYQSFRYSQGNTYLQTELYNGLKRFYETTGFDYRPALKSSCLEQKAAKLAMPKAHSGEPLAEGIFLSEWDNFLKADQNPVYMAPRGIVGLTIESDLGYQTATRSLWGADVHKSYFRQYVMLAESTANPAFDYVFKQAGNACLGNMAELVNPEVSSLPDLIVKWESNHPGEKFMPVSHS